MKKSMELYMNAAGWVIGLVGAGYAIGVHCKMNALAKKLDSKIDRLADDAAIQIPDYIIKDAVDKAVVNRTDYAIQRATNAAITDIHAETARQVIPFSERYCYINAPEQLFAPRAHIEINKQIVNRLKEHNQLYAVYYT